MSTWNDKPNDYEHAIVMIEELRVENERLRGLFKSMHWHLAENTVNREVFFDIVETALADQGKRHTISGSDAAEDDDL